MVLAFAGKFIFDEQPTALTKPLALEAIQAGLLWPLTVYHMLYKG